MRDERSREDRHGDTYPGTPLWVKIFGGIAVLVVLLFLFLLLVGSGHGPGRHAVSAANGLQARLER